MSAYGLSGEIGGILIEVPAGSAAEKAGLKQGDVILKCQDQEIRSVDELHHAFAGLPKGPSSRWAFGDCSRRYPGV
ncbi:MAG: PDZ domain-containing protein [Tepidisphaeraceae bacterium]